MTSSTCSLLVNREKAGRFDTVKNDRFVAPASVFEEILSQFENDLTAATEWMSRLVCRLGSQRPLNMIRARVETEAVIDLIGRLESGRLYHVRQTVRR
jgi:putative toxin-antitoxin system antitoxin component (TIGR02293 family)